MSKPDRSAKPDEPVMKMICIDRRNIRDNDKDGGFRPVIDVLYADSDYLERGTRVEIKGPSTVVYSQTPNEMTHCGARSWIETDAEVEVIE